MAVASPLGIERGYGRQILDQRVCTASGRLSCERAPQRLEEKRLTRRWND